MSQKIEFFFDIASPYTYLAATQLAGLEKFTQVEWRPFLIGGVFKGANNSMPAAVPAKGQYMFNDLKRLSAYYGVPFKFTSYFPGNSLLAMRVLTAADAADMPALAMKLFQAYWVDDRNIGDAAVVADIAGAALVEKAGTDAVKEKLKASTEEAISRGAFGAPTFFHGSDMYFGEDRIFLLEHALKNATK